MEKKEGDVEHTGSESVLASILATLRAAKERQWEAEARQEEQQHAAKTRQEERHCESKDIICNYLYQKSQCMEALEGILAGLQQDLQKFTLE